MTGCTVDWGELLCIHGERSQLVCVCGGGVPKRARAAVTQVCLCFEGCKSLQECIGMDWQQSRTNALDQLMGGGGLSQLLIPVLERGKKEIIFLPSREKKDFKLGYFIIKSDLINMQMRGLS